MKGAREAAFGYRLSQQDGCFESNSILVVGGEKGTNPRQACSRGDALLNRWVYLRASKDGAQELLGFPKRRAKKCCVLTLEVLMSSYDTTRPP